MKKMFDQPKAFWLVFMLEVWERYGFYTIQALLVTYLIHKFHFTDAMSDVMFGSFASLAYLLTGLGGIVGDRYLGTKRTIVIGAVTLATGYFIFSLPDLNVHWVALGLTMVAVGNGFFKANPSSLLSKVYQKGRYNQDSGFTLYYMAISVGGLTAILLAPVIAEHFHWMWAYRLAFVGLVLVLITYTSMRGAIKNVGSKPDLKPLRKDIFLYVMGCALAILLIGWWLMGHERLMSIMLTFGTLIFLFIYVVQIFKAKKSEQNGMILFLLLFTVGCIYWAFYFQMPTSLTLFAIRNVDHHLLFFTMHGQQYMGMEAIFIILMGPVMARIYEDLRRCKKRISIATKFAWGMAFLAATFLVIPFSGFFQTQGVISSWWMVLLYWLQAVSELLISALGFSMVSRYIPQRLMGFVMGLWLLTISMGTLFAGYIAAIANIPSNLTHDPVKSFSVYSHLFLELGLVALGVSGILFACLPLLNRLSKQPGVK